MKNSACLAAIAGVPAILASDPWPVPRAPGEPAVPAVRLARAAAFPS
jgi:hypothetical protein